MILDRLENRELYFRLGPGIERALRFLAAADLTALPEGRHPVEGDRIYALVQEYEPRPPEAAAWEAHRRYADVQYVVSGEERLGRAEVERLAAGDYDEAKDLLLLTGQGDFFTLRAGCFAIFLPHDAHAPGLATDRLSRVRKVVVKVAMDLVSQGPGGASPTLPLGRK